MTELWTSFLLGLPPGMLLMIGGLMMAMLRPGATRVVMLALPLLGLWHLWWLPDGHVSVVHLFWYDLELIRIDALSRVFATVFHLAAFLGAVYALHVRDRIQHTTAFIYAGASIAAACVGDLISLFIFWEITAISSVFLIWAGRTERAVNTGMRYLVIQVASGVLLLTGATLHYAATGSMAFTAMKLDSAGPVLIFLAFGIKAAFPLLHNWLQDAYPEATVTGTVFLSAFTTKLAIYALARGFPGTEILIPIGAVMTIFPIFYAVIENDLRKVLAYSLNNQLGFMVVGIGIGTEMALNGAAAHAFAHIIYKGLLFMCMGAVLYRTKTIKASELGGLYKSMPWTTAFCLVGSLSISGFPLFSGFISKSMILTAGAEAHMLVLSLVLLFASAGVVDHSGIKIPFFAFFAHDSGKRVKEAPLNMLLAMGGGAAICIGLGLFPGVLYRMLPYPVDYVPYTKTHVITMLQLLLFAALAFVVLLRSGFYPAELRKVNLDSDWLYRKAAPAVVGVFGRVYGWATGFVSGLTAQIARVALAPMGRAHSPRGFLGEPWLTGTTALWAAVILAASLILYYL